MKDISTPVPQNEVRTVIKKSLENAALVNYERLSEEARIEGKDNCLKNQRKLTLPSVPRTNLVKIFKRTHLSFSCTILFVESTLCYRKV